MNDRKLPPVEMQFAQEEMETLLNTLAARFHQTVILVTRDMDLAREADTVISLHSGEICKIENLKY